MRMSPIEVPCPLCQICYASAGGNSSQTTDVTLNTPTLEELPYRLVRDDSALADTTSILELRWRDSSQ